MRGRVFLRELTVAAGAVAVATAVTMFGMFAFAPRICLADDEATLRQFLAAANERQDLDAGQKSSLKSAAEQAFANAAERRQAILKGLSAVEPRFGDAIAALASETPQPGRVLLEKLAADRDPYVAATALDLLGRHLAERGEAAAALPHLTSVTETHANRVLGLDAALLARGRVEAELLRRAEAANTWERLLRDFPDLPAETRTEVEEQLTALSHLAPGSLDDVRDRMGYSRRQLTQAEVGEPLRAEQRRIIEMLDELIDRASQQEGKSGKGKGKGQKSGQANGQGAGSGSPGSGAGEGQGQGKNDPSEGPAVRKLSRGGPQSPWGQLRDKQRDPAFSAIKEKVPARYQQLIEQYYRSFQEDSP